VVSQLIHLVSGIWYLVSKQDYAHLLSKHNTLVRAVEGKLGPAPSDLCVTH
jgi:hypothetical protein